MTNEATVQQNIKTNLGRLMVDNGITEQVLAVAIGVSQQAVNKWKTTGKVGKANLSKVAEFFKTTPDLLMAGGNKTNLDPNLLPLLSWVQAGDWADALPFSYDTIEVPMLIKRPGCFVLQVRGNSMSRPEGLSYFDGCYVVVDPNIDRTPECLLHKVVVARTSEGATIKEFILEGNLKRLHPWNPDPSFHDLEVTEDTYIIGEVIKMFY